MILFLILFGIFVYFVPSIAALSRRHKNSSAIVILNLLLGWTFLGWVIAFVWAYTSNLEESQPPMPEKIDPSLQWDRSAIYENGQLKNNRAENKSFLDKLKNLDLK
jgi:hypothetical protein